MKSLVFALCVVAVAVLADEKEPEPNDTKVKIKVAWNKCQADPKAVIDWDKMKLYLNGEGDRPENAGAHAVCIVKDLTWMKPDGKLNKEVLQEKIFQRHHKDPAKAQRIVDECAVDLATPEESALRQIQCYWNNVAKKDGTYH